MTISKEASPFGNSRTAYLTTLSVLLALVVGLQLIWTLGGVTSFSVVLVPIVVGAILLGPAAGAILGYGFGVAVLILGITGRDFFTATLFQAQPVATSFLCLLKGTAAGVGAGLVYRLVEKKSGKRLIAAFAAAATAPILNTGLFILCAILLLKGTLAANLTNFGWSGESVLLFLIIGCAGINFLLELAVNLILAPAIHRIVSEAVRLVGRQKKHRS